MAGQVADKTLGAQDAAATLQRRVVIGDHQHAFYHERIQSPHACSTWECQAALAKVWLAPATCTCCHKAEPVSARQALDALSRSSHSRAPRSSPLNISKTLP